LRDFETAPLDPAGLGDALRPFGQSRMLPRRAYMDPEVFDWEQRHFFCGWTCVGRSQEVPDPGDQRAGTAGRFGVLVVRGSDGVVRCFANACRHRGHELLPSGTARNLHIVVCPYHSWSYRLDGTLRGAPGFDGLDGFTASDYGLVGLPTVEWHGLVFVDVSRRAGSFDDHVRGLAEIVDPYELNRLQGRGKHDYVVQANWKILCENYQECYHCPTIHPQLCRVSPPNSGANYRPNDTGAWVGGWMGLAEGAVTMSTDGTSPASGLRGLDAERRRQVIYLVLFPNVLLSLHPDYVMTHLLTPLAPGRTRVDCAWAFAPEDVAHPGFDPTSVIDFWDGTNRQDWTACESVQRGLSTTEHSPGPLSPREDGVYYYVTMVARGYAGLPLGSPVVPAL
jgi:glycine betaine catabolism A